MEMTKLCKKILAVTEGIGAIKKDKENSFHKYQYVSDEAIVTKIRDLLIAHRLVVVPSQLSCVQSGDLTTLTVQYSLIDVDSGEYMLTQVFGQGQDKGDKGVYKAATGAEKYFLLKTFLIPTSDDPEAENGQRPSQNTRSVPKAESSEPARNQERLISEAQRKRFYAIAKQAGVSDSEIKEFLRVQIGSEHTSEIPVSRYEKLCAAFQQQ